MRTAIVGLVLVLVVATVCVEGYTNQTRIIGNTSWGDRLLDQAWAVKIAKRNQVQVYNYKYPKRGTGGVITCIKVLDQWYNGTNGDVYLNSGGVGARVASLSIRSKLGYGLQYNIELWGR